MAVLQVFQAKLLQGWPRPRSIQRTVQRNRPGFMCHQDHGPGVLQVHSQPSGARVPPVVDTDGDHGMRTMSPSWSQQSPPLACSNPLWKGSQSTSLWHRSRPRQCKTSFLQGLPEAKAWLCAKGALDSSFRSLRFLPQTRTRNWNYSAQLVYWKSTWSVPPSLGSRTSSSFASVTAPKGIRSRKQRLWACSAPLEYEHTPQEALPCRGRGLVSIAEICAVAGWASPSTFARFYNLFYFTFCLNACEP